MKNYVWIIVFLVGIIFVQSQIDKKLNEYENKINDIKNEIKLLETSINNNKKQIANIQISRGTGRTFKMIATAYSTADYGVDNITASGNKVRLNHTVAVDPKIIPLGSILYIQSDYEKVNGYYVAEDVGSMIKNNKIDIYMNEKDVDSFGVRQVEVTVIKSGWSG